MDILCTICARSGSKGVKNKNIITINKKPLIYYTIKQAKKSLLFTNIVLSTDSLKISKIGKKYGADVFFLRPKSLSRDTTGKIPAIRHALIMSEKYYNKYFDYIIDLDVTSPLRLPLDIKRAFKQFIKTKSQILISANRSRRNPYFNAVEKRNNKIRMVKQPRTNIKRRQDAPSVWDMNASIYIWKRKSLLKSDNLFRNKTSIYEMPEKRSWDLDTNFDFEIIKYLIKKNFKKYA